MSPPTRGIRLAVLAMSLSLAGSAYAQPEEPAEEEAPDAPAPEAPEAPAPSTDEPLTDDEKKAKAAQYYLEGQRLFQDELYAAAIENFKKAQALYKVAVNLYNIAKSYERLGDGDNCIVFYEKYIEFHKKTEGSDPADIVDVRNSIAKCRLGARVSVRIDSDPVGASVYIGSKDTVVGQTPYTTRLDPGTYKIFLDLAKHQPFERTIEIRSGEPLQLVFKLEKVQRNGTIRVTSNIRNATVFIDGKNLGLTPYDEEIVVPEGVHQVTVSKDEYVSYARELQVNANEAYEVEANLWLRDPPGTWKGYVGWTSMILGVGLGVGGFFAGKEADTKFSDSSDFDQWSRLQKIGYGGGGGLFGMGLLLVILEAGDDEQVKPADRLSGSLLAPRRPRFMPMIGASSRGAFAGTRVEF